MSANNSFSIFQYLLAWSVHLFTASGLVSGFMAILAINLGDWREAMLWLILCLVIDGIDGTFARLFKVKEVLPFVDGKMIDYVVDFATYAIIPAYFFYMTGIVEESWRLPLVALILLVSAVYYGKDGMVSEDMYFIGFPVLWNLVVYYLIFVFHLPNWANVALIIFFAILHFVPVKFAYPSQGTRFKWLNIGMTLVFIFSFFMNVYSYPNAHFIFPILAVLCIFHFGFLAIYSTWFDK